MPPELAGALRDLLALMDEALAVASTPNGRGWVRLVEILRAALDDPAIQSSAGAAEFVRIAIALASDALSLGEGALAFHDLDGHMPLGAMGKRHKAKQQERARLERPRPFAADGNAVTRRALIGQALRAAGPEPTTHEVMDQLLGLLGAKGLPAQDEGAKGLRKIVTQDDEGNAVIFAFGTVQKTLAALREEAGAPQSKRGRPRKKQTQPG